MQGVAIAFVAGYLHRQHVGMLVERTLDQQVAAFGVVRLTRRKIDYALGAAAVDDQVQLGAEAAPRSTEEGLRGSPGYPPDFLAAPAAARVSRIELPADESPVSVDQAVAATFDDRSPGGPQQCAVAAPQVKAVVDRLPRAEILV